MNTEQVVEKVCEAGGQLALIDGGLRGKNLTDFTRQLVKRHKADIIQLLLESSPVEPLLKPCPICFGREFVHRTAGGYYCTTCQPNAGLGQPVQAGSIRRKKA